MEPIKKEDKRKGLIVTGVFHVVLLLALLFTHMQQADPPFPQEELMVLDFSQNAGAGTSGGHEKVSEKEQESAKESIEETHQEPTENVATQQDAPVSKPSKPNTTNSSSTQGSSNSGQAAMDYGNLFGSGGGDESGHGGGSGTAPGSGSGPGISGDGWKEGIERKPIKMPKVKNPTQDIGTVMVKITIDHTGKVIKAEADMTHDRTTTVNPILVQTAVENAKKIEYGPGPTGIKFQTGLVPFDFILE